VIWNLELGNLFLGVVQAITEFLPISSSGHLHIFQLLWGITPNISTDIWLNSATLLAVLVYFSLPGRHPWLKLSPREKIALLFRIFLASLPAGLVGLLFKDQINILFSSSKLLPLTYLFSAFFLFSLRFPRPVGKQLDNKKALIIGLAQALAVLPGVSRSAATIATASWFGLPPEEAFQFSFLLYVPASIGALALSVSDISATAFPLSVFLPTAILGFVSLSLLHRLFVKHRLWLFAFYCLALSAFLLLFF